MRLPARAIRKRKRLFTQAELAARLGVHERTVRALEAKPFSDLFMAYVQEIGYGVILCPQRNKHEPAVSK